MDSIKNIMAKEEVKTEQKRFKADTRNLIDVTLLGICITLFGLVATIKPEMLSQNPFFVLQLVLAVPFFVCGLLARVKEAAYNDSYRWKRLNFISFTLAYGFFINAIGLLLSFITPIYVPMAFFAVNTLLTITRASIVVSYSPSKLKNRIFRETIHIALIVFLGILPAFRVY
jgi:hypothetical protein